MVHLLQYLASASTQITAGLKQVCSSGACNDKATLSNIFTSIANMLTFIIGAVSVIMIIVGGLRYVTSNGDSKQAESARNTILYAVIGVIIAIAAFAIVNFVVANIK